MLEVQFPDKTDTQFDGGSFQINQNVKRRQFLDKSV